SCTKVTSERSGGWRQARADVELRRQRPVHRASIRHLQEPRALLFVQRAADGYFPLDAIKHAFLGLALGAVDGVDLRVFELDRNTLERPLLASRIQRERHRRSGS